MIELFDELRTCDDVRAFGTRGIGEGPMMDYKESIPFREQGTLTEGAKKELARDVSALANAQGGMLVIGVKAGFHTEEGMYHWLESWGFTREFCTPATTPTLTVVAVKSPHLIERRRGASSDFWQSGPRHGA